MSYTFPGMLIPWIERRFTYEDGTPLALGTIESYQAGTTTALATYADADLTTANGVVITLDGGGCAPNPMYMLPQQYKFIVKDVDGVVQSQYPFDDVGDDGQILAEYFGTYLAAGSKSVISGYIQLVTDHYITVQSTGGPNPCLINLLPAASWRWPLRIKNIGNVKVRLVPNGLDTLEGQNTYLQIPAASYPYLPTVELFSDEVSAVQIVGSHGFSIFV